MTRQVFRDGRRAKGATRYFDRRGRPIPKSVWQHLSQTHAYTHVAMDAVGVGANGSIAHVYTFWLGVAEGYDRLIFRTALPPQGLPGLLWGWATETDACAGHRAVCACLADRTGADA
jgi:hypothetical protein